MLDLAIAVTRMRMTKTRTGTLLVRVLVAAMGFEHRDHLAMRFTCPIPLSLASPNMASISPSHLNEISSSSASIHLRWIVSLAPTGRPSRIFLRTFWYRVAKLTSGATETINAFYNGSAYTPSERARRREERRREKRKSERNLHHQT